MRVVPETVQLEAVPVVAAYVTLPVPDPPDVVIVKSVPYVPLVEEIVSVDCEACAKVTVVCVDEIDK